MSKNVKKTSVSIKTYNTTKTLINLAGLVLTVLWCYGYASNAIELAQNW